MITIRSVNIGTKRVLTVGKREMDTGIYKQPVATRIDVGLLGLATDVICDARHHGGVDQAVYLYRQEDYDWWSQEMGEPVLAGTFGENLTLEGISDPFLNIGDRLRFSELTLEVTAPRIPCSTLAARMGDAGFVKAFIRAERPGFYCRVITQGSICKADKGSLEAAEFTSISTLEFYRDLQRKMSAEKINQYLALPIDERSRKDFESRLR